MSRWCVTAKTFHLTWESSCEQDIWICFAEKSRKAAIYLEFWPFLYISVGASWVLQNLPVSLSLTLLIIWMAFLLSASGCTKPSPTKKKKEEKAETAWHQLQTAYSSVVCLSLCSWRKSGLKCCLAIAQRLHPSRMTARERGVVVKRAEKYKRVLQQQEELVTHWRSEWTQALWSLVSCVWSLQGLFPQGPLQGHHTVTDLNTFLHYEIEHRRQVWPLFVLQTHPLIVQRCTSRSWCGNACCLWCLLWDKQVRCVRTRIFFPPLNITIPALILF